MKYLLLALALTGCLLEPEQKTITVDHQVDPSCLREDSATWTDTSETKHMTCELVDPKPQAP